ncbi:NAD-dependent protein deacetylase Sirt6 isoform X2 [Ischnura elegans]|uniref:NAD-dependent protein deacetylase Sirt6 isoform X2 n=1 Tax=Ischnura elegans TaxID=197161 RepID=UPI001ED8BCED|nr:NAD-dependent protein deacetylase Sirt6 isoform X2 [Ischnura elegans]
MFSAAALVLWDLFLFTCHIEQIDKVFSSGFSVWLSMSCNYADGLSPYEYKGKLGLSEKFDSEEDVEKKVAQVAEWLNNSKHVVVHTGAGISTSAGIPDFRGPNGVWTLEEKGMKPNINTSFDDAVPTFTHMALASLVKHGKIHYVVSQNIDGLHLKSGLQRSFISELHGNMFIDECDRCDRQFVRSNATKSVGQKNHGIICPMASSGHKRPCRGHLCDTILDWEAHLPEKDLKLAEYHSGIADLSIALGTTLQIVPSGNLPTHTKKHGGRLVICNLQPTKQDKKADLMIHTYVDSFMKKLMKLLNITPESYSEDKDPTKVTRTSDKPIEWTIHDRWVKAMQATYETFRKTHLVKKTVKHKRKKEDCEDEKVELKEENGVCPEVKNIKLESSLGNEEIKREKIDIEATKSEEKGDEMISNVIKEENEDGVILPEQHMASAYFSSSFVLF